MQSVFLSVLQHKYRNSNCYYRLLLLFLSDIRLNPGPSYNLHQLDPLRKKCSYSKSFSSAFSRIFPAVSPRIQSECGKMWTRITPNTDTCHSVIMINGIFFSIKDYIFFTSISAVCCRKLMNIGIWYIGMEHRYI